MARRASRRDKRFSYLRTRGSAGRGRELHASSCLQGVAGDSWRGGRCFGRGRCSVHGRWRGALRRDGFSGRRRCLLDLSGFKERRRTWMAVSISVGGALCDARKSRLRSRWRRGAGSAVSLTRHGWRSRGGEVACCLLREAAAASRPSRAVRRTSVLRVVGGLQRSVVPSGASGSCGACASEGLFFGWTLRSSGAGWMASCFGAVTEAWRRKVFGVSFGACQLPSWQVG